MDRHIYCNNCGKHGHTYKDCKYPVLSCGNIVFRSDTTEPKILMIQRKDSLCYIDFVRGKYDTYNIPYIQTLLNKCTTDERHGLVTKSYEQLWKELWLVDILDNVNHNEYSKGYDKFTRLKSGFFYYKTKVYISLQYFIDNSDTNYITPEWEFPKGRRNNKESDRDCAIREFREETKPEFNHAIEYISESKTKNLAIFVDNQKVDRETLLIINNYMFSLGVSKKNNIRFFDFYNIPSKINNIWIVCFEPVTGIHCKDYKIKNKKWDLVEEKKYHLLSVNLVRRKN